jgi:predicted phosphoribosyltransferase
MRPTDVAGQVHNGPVVALPFQDRADAGRALARRLVEAGLTGGAGAIVLALPRGGVPVGYEVARALQAPLDVLLVRKLGVPGQEELAFGAVASGGLQVLNDAIVAAIGLTADEIAAIAARETDAIAHAEQRFRHGRPPLVLRGTRVILVDDGLATGASMRVAARAVRAQAPAHVVIAAPVGAREACASLLVEADEVMCAEVPEPFEAVGLWYRDFSQTTDAEVRALLDRQQLST